MCNADAQAYNEIYHLFMLAIQLPSANNRRPQED